MQQEIDPHRVKALCAEIKNRIDTIHIACFQNRTEPLFLISETYPGIWLEHVYDAVLYAQMNPQKRFVAVNTIRLFMEQQTADGQYPCYIWDAGRVHTTDGLVGYGQIQECVSFAGLCYRVYEMTQDRALLETMYASLVKWEHWLTEHRMTTNRGLIEQFVGFDTGHDNSARNDGLAHPGNHTDANGCPLNAATLPNDDGITPILAVDMNCNFYATEQTLAQMAQLLERPADAAFYHRKAQHVKENLFRHCYDADDCFFYDADRTGQKRNIKSSTILHLFLEHVLDPTEDRQLIADIYTHHIKNPEEFWTPVPFPAVAANDPTWLTHKKPNSWGYYSQALIALRCSLWMDDYGFSADYDEICRRWLSCWTNCYETLKFGQELDPITGKPSTCSEWYSSCMLLYLYAANRLEYLD